MSQTIQQTESSRLIYGRPLTELATRPSRSADRTMKYMGYVAEYSPLHPACSKAGYVAQHRLEAEHYLLRFLSPKEVVHHEDLDRTNNHPANLWVFPSQAAHMRHHKRNCPRYDAGLAARVLPLAESARSSMQDAARELGVSVSTVRALVDVHGIQWKSAAVRDISEMSVREALSGRSTLEAALALGVNHQTLRNRFPHLLEKRAPPGFLESHKEEIRSLATHTRADDIAERLGVCGETVRVAIRRWARIKPGAWSGVSAFQQSRLGLGRPPRRKA